MIVDERAECGDLAQLLSELGGYLDEYLLFEHDDAARSAAVWHGALERAVPDKGVGISALVKEIGEFLIPYGSSIPKPGCTSFITTGAVSAGALATLAGSVASPQRFGFTAFNYLEELSLRWMREMFELPDEMEGVYSSGGSVANLVALGAARQRAFEKLRIDPARDGVTRSCRLYATQQTHHTIQRSCGVLGLGRKAVVMVEENSDGTMCPQALRAKLEEDSKSAALPVAIVANAGSTSTGSIDLLRQLGEIAQEYDIWFHVDGAYGLPGILDPSVRARYDGLVLADSVTVDPHKWLGAPVGIGATYVKDIALLSRCFTQEQSDYLEGSCYDDGAAHSLESLGTPYFDYGVELSAPSRGAVVWALIREIGKDGLRERVCRHNAMARYVAARAEEHPNLELLIEPSLSVCCFRFISCDIEDHDDFNRRIHRQLVQNNINMPSTAIVNGKLAIRPCFVGARTAWAQADGLLEEVLKIGKGLSKTGPQ